MHRYLTASLSLMVVASCFFGTPVFAGELVRADPSTGAVAVAHRPSAGDWSVWLAPDGTRFERLPFDQAWILDMVFLPGGDLLVAHGPIPREGGVQLTRVGETSVTTPFVDAWAVGEVLFVRDGSRVALMHNGGGSISTDAGVSFTRVGSWEEGYGFYAATAVMNGPDNITLLAPQFETCSSSDLLYEVHAYSLSSGEVEVRGSEENEFYAPVAGSGVEYRAREIDMGGACEIVAVSGGNEQVLHSLEPNGGCWMQGRTEAESTVVYVAQHHVISVSPTSATALGSTSATIEDAIPWQDGALALTSGGQLIRFSAGSEPDVLWTVPNARADNTAE
ncbi:MAG: hypothetical protein KC561_07880 [Myxococcales bacterium]|nr:hypothetical protein [Myxococcales bacterium]